MVSPGPPSVYGSENQQKFSRKTLANGTKLRFRTRAEFTDYPSGENDMTSGLSVIAENTLYGGRARGYVKHKSVSREVAFRRTRARVS